MRTLLVEMWEAGAGRTTHELTGLVPFSDEDCTGIATKDDFLVPMGYADIQLAADVATGEVISVRQLCGGPEPPGPIGDPPQRKSRPTGRSRAPRAAADPALRKKDERAFYANYRLELLWNHFRYQLFAAFNGRCFACAAPKGLRLDHHVPLALGGRLVPGNITVLCTACNRVKADHPPEVFYSQDELTHLEPILAAEAALLCFTFDQEAWFDEPIPYLRRVGINELLIHEMVSNPSHPYHYPGFRDFEHLVR